MNETCCAFTFRIFVSCFTSAGLFNLKVDFFKCQSLVAQSFGRTITEVVFFQHRIQSCLICFRLVCSASGADAA